MRGNVFRAFQSYNYRLYFAGQSVSLIGTWMQRTAVYWLVYTETQSSFMLGMTVFSNQFPSFLFSLFGGVVSDRYNRFKVLLITQIASLIQAVLLSVLVISNQYNVWHILALSVILGIINAFDVPARQAMVYDMVDNKEHLPNAIALNSSMVHGARLLGPSVAGFILQWYGAGFSFLINAITFVVVIASLLLMHFPPYKKVEHVHSPFRDLKNGFNYLRETPSISYIMLMLAGVSFISLPYITILPVFASEVFDGDARTFGYLNSFVGVGALAGAIFLASLKPGTNLKKVLFINTLVFGLGLILFSVVTNLSAALAFMAMVGFGMMSQTTISNTLIQTSVAPAMRGRVLSYYAMAFFGMQPLGGLLVGAFAEKFGAPNTVLVEGLATLMIALIFLPFLRRREFESKHKMKMEQLEERSIETT